MYYNWAKVARVEWESMTLTLLSTASSSKHILLGFCDSYKRHGFTQLSLHLVCYRVHNIKRLRIADASVMPTLPNGMAGTAVLAIAEKAAELLIEKWDMQTSIQRDLSTE